MYLIAILCECVSYAFSVIMSLSDYLSVITWQKLTRQVGGPKTLLTLFDLEQFPIIPIRFTPKLFQHTELMIKFNNACTPSQAPSFEVYNYNNTSIHAEYFVAPYPQSCLYICK